MREYLDRELLLAEYDRRHEGPPGGARKMIAEFPAANFTDEEEPLEKCGKWRTDGNKRTCSVCEFTHCYGGYKLFKYCPECGAKMDVRSVCSTSKEADETEEQK